MATVRHLYVFAYDVERDAARAKLARLIEQRMIRVQKSVFEGRMTAAEAQRLSRQAALLLRETDSLRVYCLTVEGLEGSFASGGAPLAEKSGFLLL